MALTDKELALLLRSYKAPPLDPDVLAQGLHAAIHCPLPPSPLKPPGRAGGGRGWFRPHWRGGIFPVPARAGLAVAAMLAFALILGVFLPFEGFKNAQKLDNTVNTLIQSEQTADNDIRAADQLFSLLSPPATQPAPAASPDMDQILPDSLENNTPIWDQFMGRG